MKEGLGINNVLNPDNKFKTIRIDKKNYYLASGNPTALQNTVKALVKKRTLHKENNEPEKALATKLVGNITYGTLGLQIPNNPVRDVTTARFITYFARGYLRRLVSYLENLKYEVGDVMFNIR